jgi:hypothetical protein
MKNHFLSAVIFITCLANATAQTQQTNLDKYWHYRQRLTTDFLLVGEQQGMSMPASRIDTIQQRMAWGDNTIGLGFYIGMLATEHYMLSNPQKFSGYNGGDTSALTRTENELYYALKGLRRLDETAEISFPSPCDSLGLVRNGFILRDDVPADFHSNFANITSVKSDYTSANVYDNEMSQDQVYHVLTGLALVKKFVPSTLIVNGMNIRQEAIEQGLKIAEWVSTYSWTIKNPACLVSGNPKDVARGANATLFSHGLNLMVKYLSDETVNYDTLVMPSAITVWNTLNVSTNPGYSNTDNIHMAMTIAAVGKGWDTATLPALMDLGTKNKWAAYPMIYCLLHNDTAAAGFPVFRDTLNMWSEDMLNEAPAEGPYNDYPLAITHGYGVWNRFIRARTQHYIGDATTMKNKFSGLDYMLLHNLYYALSPSKWTPLLNSIGDDAKDDIVVKLYPNPATHTLFVAVANNENKKLQVQIFNSFGQQVYQSSMLNEKGIDVRGLGAGMYVLVLGDGEGKKSRGVFVVEKH